MNAGRFDKQLIQNIDSSDIFIFLLTQNSLDQCFEEKDFVRLEISRAIRQGKVIIPVMDEGVEFPKQLPDDIAQIANYESIKWFISYVDAAYDKLLERINYHASKNKIDEKVDLCLKAGEQVGKIYDCLSEQYYDRNSQKAQYSLNVLCVRIVFCLYAEDAGLLAPIGTSSADFFYSMNPKIFAQQ